MDRTDKRRNWPVRSTLRVECVRYGRVDSCSPKLAPPLLGTPQIEKKHVGHYHNVAVRNHLHIKPLLIFLSYGALAKGK